MGTKREKDSLAFLLNSGARLLNSAFERRISEAGLGLTPGEARALLTVAVVDGSKQSDIAARLGIEPSQKLLVLLGGSQGSGNLNQWAEQNLEALAHEGVQVHCVTGLGKGREGVRELHDKSGRVVRSWSPPVTSPPHCHW